MRMGVPHDRRLHQQNEFELKCEASHSLSLPLTYASQPTRNESGTRHSAYQAGTMYSACAGFCKCERRRTQ
jgi:hypothetical protein